MEDPFTGQLKSLNESKLLSFPISKSTTQIKLGRLPSNDIILQDPRCSSKHCVLDIIQHDPMQINVTDLSSNGTYLNNIKIGKNQTIKAESNDFIILLSQETVGKYEMLGFQIIGSKEDKPPQKRPKLEYALPDISNQLKDEILCIYCNKAVYQPLTQIPCMHNGCAGCIAVWLTQNNGCKQCNEIIQETRRNKTLEKLREEFLQTNPQYGQTEQEIEWMLQNQRLNQDRNIISKNINLKFGQEYQNNNELMSIRSLNLRHCRQCKKKVNNFQCQSGQQHIQCSECLKLMPQRNDQQQTCSLCNVAFCNLYWQNSYCREGIMEIRNHAIRTFTEIPNTSFQQNFYEQNIVKDYIKFNSLNISEIAQAQVEELIQQQEQIEINGKILNIRYQTLFCNKCAMLVWCELIYRFRLTIQKDLPKYIQQRPDCWYGSLCRTQPYHITHAQKFNHICNPRNQQFSKMSYRHSTQETTYSSNLNFNPPSPRPLPEAPLVTFDLHFDNLKEFLQNVQQVVNQHGSFIKQVMNEIRSKFSVQEASDLLQQLSMALPREMEGVLQMHGNEWRDGIAPNVNNLNVIGKNILDFLHFKSSVNQRFQHIENKLKKKCSKDKVKKEVKDAKKKVNKKLKERCHELDDRIKLLENNFDQKIEDLTKQFKELEINTFWKLKDVENLLQIRVNEKFVWDALQTLEDKLRKELGGAKAGALEDIQRKMQALEKNMQQMNLDFINQINKLKQQVKETDHKVKEKNDQKDFFALKNEVELLKQQICFDDIIQQISNANQKIEQLELEIDALKNKEVPQMQKEVSLDGVYSEINKLKEIVSELSRKKANMEQLDLLMNQLKGSQSGISRNELDELWRFRDKVLEHIKDLERKIQKIARSLDLTQIRQLIATKTDDKIFQSSQQSQDNVIEDIQKGVKQFFKDLDHLNNVVKRIWQIVQELSTKGASSLVSTRHFVPANCLSCGRGDANFIPALPHVQGTDGKLYRMDGSIIKGQSASGNFDTGQEVFIHDGHEYAHTPRFEELETKTTSFGIRKNIKTIRRNVMPSQSATTLRKRPQSARNN